MNGPYLTNPLQQINDAWKQGRDNAFQEQAGKALTTTGPDQQAALTQAAQLNPEGSLDLAQKTQQVNGQKLVSMAKFLVNAPDEQKNAIYQSLKPTLAQVGIDPSTLPDQYDDTVAQTAKSLVGAYTPYNAQPAAVRTAEYFSQNLTPEQKAEAMRIKVGLDPRATNPNYSQVEIPDGQGGKILAFYNKKTGKPELPDYSDVGGPGPTGGQMPGQGGIGQPTPGAGMGNTGGWNVTTSKPSLVQMANDALDAGAPSPEAAINVALKRSGQPPEAFSGVIPQGGNRFQERQLPAGTQPTQVDAQGNEVAPTAAPAPRAAPAAPAGGGLGYTPAKQDTNEIAKRQENLDHFAAAGIQLSPDEQKQYLLDGKPPAQADKPLSPDQEKAAQMLANYSLGASAKFFGDAKNLPIIARAAALNPDWQQSNYDLNKKYLSDLQSNSPTSTGGGVVAANTALSHLQAMSDLSQQLPDYKSKYTGQIGNFIGEAGNGPLGDNLKQWETEAQLMAAEVQKMIKSGVATEGETKAMLDNLNPSAPRSQRDKALAALAAFMNDKVAEQETKRDQVLGAASPATSLLNGPAQDKLKTVLERGGHDVPDLRAPSTTLRAATTPAQAQPASAPAAAPVAPPPAAQNYLRAHPEARDQFDAKYGPGSSAKILGG